MITLHVYSKYARVKSGWKPQSLRVRVNPLTKLPFEGAHVSTNNTAGRVLWNWLYREMDASVANGFFDAAKEDGVEIVFTKSLGG